MDDWLICCAGAYPVVPHAGHHRVAHYQPIEPARKLSSSSAEP